MTLVATMYCPDGLRCERSGCTGTNCPRIPNRDELRAQLAAAQERVRVLSDFARSRIPFGLPPFPCACEVCAVRGIVFAATADNAQGEADKAGMVRYEPAKDVVREWRHDGDGGMSMHTVVKPSSTRSAAVTDEDAADLMRELVTAGRNGKPLGPVVTAALESFASAHAPAGQGGEDARGAARSGIYVASRVKHAAMWRGLRSMQRLPINSSWIDEDGEGETEDFSELWHRIESEVKRSGALVLYVEAADFPLKGALIECGIALAADVPIFVYTNAELEGRTMRPLGSWILDSRVTMCASLMDAIDAAIASQNNRQG